MPEKIDCRWIRMKRGETRRSGYVQFVKRQTAKLLRRRGRQEFEDAPTRVRDVTRGWSS